MFEVLVEFLQQNPTEENVVRIKHYLRDRLLFVLNPPNHVKNWFQSNLDNISKKAHKDLFVNIFNEFIS